MSENIRVRSIVGRFLEHSRVFYFENGGAEDVYLASADWMERNFFRRIELCFPVLDPALKRRVIREGLQPYLDDNCQAWVMHPDGSYERLQAAPRPAPLGAGRAARAARRGRSRRRRPVPSRGRETRITPFSSRTTAKARLSCAEVARRRR